MLSSQPRARELTDASLAEPVRSRTVAPTRIVAGLVALLTLGACTVSDGEETADPSSPGPTSSADRTLATETTEAHPSADTEFAIGIEPHTVSAGEPIQVAGLANPTTDDLLIGASAVLERHVGTAWVTEWTLVETGVGLPPASVPNEVIIPSGANPFGTRQTFELPVGLQPGDYRVCVSLLPDRAKVCESVSVVP